LSGARPMVIVCSTSSWAVPAMTSFGMIQILPLPLPLTLTPAIGTSKSVAAPALQLILHLQTG
jgi:hypothetical protein